MAINKLNLNGTTYDIGEAAGTNTAESVVEFDSADEESPSSADESVALMKSGDTHKSLLEKISAGMKNIRYLLKQVTSLNSALAQVVTTPNTDLNDYWTRGTYFFTSDVTPANIPDGTVGWLEVYETEDASLGSVNQVWHCWGVGSSRAHDIYTRSADQGSFNDWVLMLTTSSIVTDTIVKDNWTIDAYDTASISISKSGYTPIGVMSIDLENATTNGVGCTYAGVYSYSLGSSSFFIGIRNNRYSYISGASIVIKASIKITYLKNS